MLSSVLFLSGCDKTSEVVGELPVETNVNSEAEKNRFSVGDIFMQGDVEVTFNDAKIIPPIEDEYRPSPEGTKLLVVDLSLENKGNEDIKTNGYDYSALDEEGNQYFFSSTYYDIDKTWLGGQVLSPGLKLSGVMKFDIPLDVNEINIQLMWGKKSGVTSKSEVITINTSEYTE